MAPTIDQRLIVVFIGAAAIRLLFFLVFPDICNGITRQIYISTPISSYSRLLEGGHLYSSGLSPYDGGVYHQAPLLLAIHQLLPHWLIYTALDLTNAWNLAVIASELDIPSPRFAKFTNQTALVAAYLFNPFTILSCLGRSTSLFTNAGIVLALASALNGNSFGALFALALANHLTLYPALLLPPLLLLILQRQSQPVTVSTLARPVAVFVALTLLLVGASYALVSGTTAPVQFLQSAYLAQIILPDLTPNIGLWWYFFIEIFDAFRNFFIGVFWTHLISYAGALTVRLPDQPVFVIIALTGLFAILKPYPSLADVSLFFALVPLYMHVWPLCRYTFLSTSVLLYTTLLGPAFYHIWIYAGSGNANFFYAITLVWALGLGMIVGDTLFAVLRDEAERYRPELKGKEVRQI